MAPYESRTTEEADDVGTGRRKASRYVVPVAVASVAAATIGLVPALAESGDPDLPGITAQELVEKIAASDTEQLSGTVKVSTDLGIPGLDGALSSLAPGGGGSDSSADPQERLTELASGTHTLRVAADGPDKQKLSIVEDASEYSLIHNGKDVWAYDSGSDEAFHAEADQGAKERGKQHEKLPEGAPSTPQEFAKEALKAVDDTTSVTVDGTAKVAGRDAYQLLIKPKQSGSTIGSVRIAVDADNGVPLKFTLSPSGGGKAVIDAGFTDVDFSAPDAKTFDYKPDKGTKVTEEDEAAEQHKGGKDGLPEGMDGLAGLEGLEGMKVTGKGWSSVASFDTGTPSPASGSGDVPGGAGQLLSALGDQVKGDFGKGTVFSTRLVNALITDDGKIYAGAVDKATLVEAANAAE